MKHKQLILTALITAFALIAFSIESAFPPITPIYGIKLGIANVFTLFTLYAMGTRQAASVLFLRIIIGSIITGQAVSFVYSLTGGILSFLLMIILKRFFSNDKIWALSALCAVAHNAGQIIAAIFMTGTIHILYYFPVLVISGIVSGACTGICAQIVLKKLKKSLIN